LILGYKEAEIWRMAPRKLAALYLAHIQYLKEQYAVMWAACPVGGSPRQLRGSIDDAIPF